MRYSDNPNWDLNYIDILFFKQVCFFFSSIAFFLVGVGIGGYLTYRINLKTLAKGAAFLCLATQALCILGPLLFVIPGCNESNIAGITKEYPAIG